MNDLLTLQNTLTMSSLEIAELTGKQHKHVLADIRKMLDELEINSAGFSAEYKDSSGKSNALFNLPKRECLVLVSGYSATLRAKIIDRWSALESTKSPQSTGQLLVQMAHAYAELEQRQIECERKTQAVEQRLDQIETGIDHFTIIGYVRTFLKRSLPLKEAATLGKLATRICTDMGIAMGTVPDPRFGQVNTYPKSVLDEVCH